MSISLHIIILAAGDGTRMKSCLPKVLHPVGGEPMLAHVLRTAASLGPEAIHVVFNPETPQVSELSDAPHIHWVPQHERLGTGHAVQQAMPEIPDEAAVLVLYGDTPLVPGDVLQQVVAQAEPLVLLTMKPADPRGYGRILRDPDGRVTGIVEERDANDEERRIKEANSGVLAARAEHLRRWLDGLRDDNDQREYLLTDATAAARADGAEIGTVIAGDAVLLEGVNDRVQLAAMESRYRQIRANALMLAGVSIADPERVELRGHIDAAQDVVLDVNVVLEGDNVLGQSVQVGAGCVLRDCSLAAGTRVHPYSVLEGVRTLGACDIGPFARLRPGTELAAGTRVGNFVETKNARLGEGSKASHLSYIGDSEVGSGVNIGAGTITCNYDGANKHRTVIGDNAFIGSDTQLIAPVTVGEGATIGAGTTLTRDAPPGELTVSRAKQATIHGWKRPVKDKD